MSSDEHSREPHSQPANLSRVTKQKLDDFRKASEKKGIVYISRVPPHMKPLKLRHMLSQYGEIGRLYLAPEDEGARKKRKQMKGNTGKNFSEGWVEFLDKRVAKKVALMLNGEQMGGKRRSAYHYDLWNLKYLSKFKWDHLTEEITYQNAIREQKMATEISAAKRERDFYMAQVDRAKAETAKAKRRENKEEEHGDLNSSDLEQAQIGDEMDTKAISPSKGKSLNKGVKRMRTYGQRKAKPDPTQDADAPEMSRAVLSLLGGSK